MSVAEPLIVRAFEPGDEEGTRTLLTKVFGDAGALVRFATGNPLGEPLRVVATLGGAVVGFNTWNAWRIHSDRPLPVVYQSGGSAVDPDTRGQGVFAKLLKKGTELGTERGIPFFVGFPNPASFKSFLRDGWLHAGSMQLRVATVPALGRAGQLAAATSTGFAAWRYQQTSAESATVETRTGRYQVYYTRKKRLGVPVLKLLDVLRDDGTRDLSALLEVCRRLPGPGPVLLRTTDDAVPGLRAFTIPRDWSTPVILKRLPAGDEGLMPALIASPFMYGDIDAV